MLNKSIFKQTFKSIKGFNNYSIKFFIKKSPLFDVTTLTPEERLHNKAKKVGSSAEQIQNYEKHILNKSNDKSNASISMDIENLLDDIDSTNNIYLKNINNPSVQDVKENELSYNNYLKQSDIIINTLKSCFDELLVQNKDMTMNIDKNNNFISIDVKKVGTYIIAKELETKLIAVTSPMSGLFKYKYDPVSRFWISTKDSHIMDELLIREFCHHSKGLLIINH
jgi:frataxin-like iron-binding protein CyaY